ncbi:APC family permease [Citrobacter amalonaticus]|uniref:Arginine/agmatine antiporter n=1 Tax=Citrobacter amalonaticus TaxID=35703 RepID=A0A8I0SV98_CITAM|nr:amino acid permease [Citrobacter amalonaticus]MBE0127646.1 amino acid permease [Citrobacter amalonaticus]MBJ9277528.1 amino acid permease [Citrobacter amalonaticus]MCR9027211.1 amino acid permease [Citrobacter amalonaticus]HAU5066239.1 amino acid permease [Citrobacter amalonaticus]
MSTTRHAVEKFGLVGAVIYGVNSIIGSGIFLLPGELYKLTGPASIIMILIDVFVVLCFALCFADCSKYFDKNGGAYQYAKYSMGDLAGFNIGVLGWLTNVIGWGVMAVGFAKLFLSLFPHLPITITQSALAIIWIFAISNFFGMRTSKNLTLIITTIKLIPIVGFCIVAVFFLKSGVVQGNFSPFVQLPSDKTLFEGISQSTLLLFYAFLGFEALPIIAAEIKSPEKNVSRAILLTVFGVSLIYFLIISGAVAILGSTIVNYGSPIQQAATLALGPVGGSIIALGAVISIAGLNMSCSIITPRIASAIADDGMLPKVFAKVNKSGAPVLSTAISAAIASVIVMSGTFAQLAELAVLMFFLQYLPTPIATIIMRYRRKRDNEVEKEGFRLPLGYVFPVLALAISFTIIATSRPVNIIFMLSSIIISSLIYYVAFKKINVLPE